MKKILAILTITASLLFGNSYTSAATTTPENKATNCSVELIAYTYKEIGGIVWRYTWIWSGVNWVLINVEPVG